VPQVMRRPFSTIVLRPILMSKPPSRRAAARDELQLDFLVGKREVVLLEEDVENLLVV
jgi:hypothetical protein